MQRLMFLLLVRRQPLPDLVSLPRVCPIQTRRAISAGSWLSWFASGTQAETPTFIDTTQRIKTPLVYMWGHVYDLPGRAFLWLM